MQWRQQTLTTSNTWPTLSRSGNMEGHLKLCPKYPLKKLLVASSITHSHLWTFFKIQTANKEQEWRVALVMKDFCSKLFNLIHRNSIESLFYWKLVYNLTVERCRYSLRRREVNPFCLLNYWIKKICNFWEKYKVGGVLRNSSSRRHQSWPIIVLSQHISSVSVINTYHSADIFHTNHSHYHNKSQVWLLIVTIQVKSQKSKGLRVTLFCCATHHHTNFS